MTTRIARTIKALAALLLCAVPNAFAQADFPSRPIRIIVPYAAGGGADILSRLLGQRLGDRLKQPVIVENQGGGSNTIGMSAVAHAARDGYTLGLATPVVRIGWPDQFIEHGKVDALREKYGITAEAALEKVRPYLATMESRRMAVR